MSLADILMAAVQRHQEGRLAEAEAGYRQVLAAAPGQPNAAYHLGVLLSDTARPEEALACYRAVLAAQPDNPELHFNMGVALDRTGRRGDAAGHYRRSLALRPGFAPALNNLGLALQASGDSAGAVAAFREATRAAPDSVDAWANLGGALARAGDAAARPALDRALALRPNDPSLLEARAGTLLAAGETGAAIADYERALALAPGHAVAWFNLGTALAAAGRAGEAEDSYRRALALEPGMADAWYNLGNLLRERGDLEAARRAYGSALAAAPGHDDARLNLATLLHELERPEAALELVDAILGRDPGNRRALRARGRLLVGLGRTEEGLGMLRQAAAADDPGARVDLGNALERLHLAAEAETAFRSALDADPACGAAHMALGKLMHLIGRPEEAAPHLRRALELLPDDPWALGSWGDHLLRNGDGMAALAAFRRAVELMPGNPAFHSNLIFALDFDPTLDVAAHQAERRRWHERHGQVPAAGIPPHGNPPDPDRRLRVGYVSADFHSHSAAHCFMPILTNHDPEEVEVVCYHNGSRHDAMTDRLRGAAALWRQIENRTDAEVAGLVRQDAIDILVDLSGHTGGHRLRVFAAKPAPVQVTAWGHATGTGLPTFDAFFADPVLVPPEERHLFAEPVVDLPVAIAMQPPEALPVAPPPALASGTVTFGSLNRLSKIGDTALALWSRCLAAVPASRLLLKDTSLDDPARRRALQDRLATAGIDPGRLVLRGATGRGEHLMTYGDIDIALDPLPYSGGISSCEALWMGVPVITLTGRSLPSRTTASLLAALGMPDLIAADGEQYVRIASALASNPAALAARRAGQRDRVRGTAVFDAHLYTRAVEAAYRRLWRDWCARRPG
ncbi:MAG TPA: tetratricopeptide repeat protein [Azospirillaceae bacterium]|nr:tetratricopeptide repeat protein [Azospirillaceae bacterium]